MRLIHLSTLVLLGCVEELPATPPVDTDAPTAAPTEPLDCSAADLEVEMGHGQDDWQPIVDGSEVVFEHGPQGGWHVYIAGHVVGGTGIVEIAPRLYWPGGEVDFTDEYQSNGFISLVGWSDDTCEGDFFGRQLFIDLSGVEDPGMDWERFVCSLRGEEMELALTVTDLETGASFEDARTVVAKPDPATNPVCN